ncbi:MAG TPA: CarD family transcriptional regulator [Vicinamibacterales bacterium]|nr:CarD family transcriptional regulator [Vicinamibacterales bacterium]
MTFQVGDKVIYPNHGLGIVERIEEKTILGTTCGFFHLRIVANDTTVLVPVANVDGVGLRKAIDDAEVERLFTLLGDGKIDNHQNWKGRFKDNSDKMRTGSIYDMADVLKSLTFLSKSKSLSFREKRMLDRAKALIISEVSEVMRQKALEVEEQVDRALEKCFTTKVRNINRTQARAKVTPKPVMAAKPVAAPVAKPIVATAAKTVVASAAKPMVATAAKPMVTTAAKPVVATAAKPVVTAKTVMSAKPMKAAVPPLVANRRAAARAS